MLGKYFLGLAIIMLGVFFLPSYGANRGYIELSTQQSQAISGLDCKKFCDGPNWCNVLDSVCPFAQDDDTCDDHPSICSNAHTLCNNMKDYEPKTSCELVPGTGAGCGITRTELCYQAFTCKCIDHWMPLAWPKCSCPVLDGIPHTQEFIDGCV